MIDYKQTGRTGQQGISSWKINRDRLMCAEGDCNAFFDFYAIQGARNLPVNRLNTKYGMIILCFNRLEAYSII